MEKLLALLDLQDKDSLKKLLVMGLTKGEQAIEAKLGVSLARDVPEELANIVVAILDSATALKEAREAGAKAAEAVKTPADADSVIGTTPGGGIVSGLSLALALCIGLMSSPALAQQSDAPVLEDGTVALTPIPVVAPTVSATGIDRSAELVPLTTGQPAPFDGRLYSNKLHVDVAKRIVNCETTLKAVEPKVGMPAWQVVLIAIGSAAVAASITAPVAVALSKNAPPK